MQNNNSALAPFSLTGKTYLVTGASGGIGRQTAITISNAGGTVVITGRNSERLAETLSLLTGEGHQMIKAELTDETSIANLAQNCAAVNGVVHSAGIVDLFPTKFINKKKIEETFAINYYAPILLMTALFKHKKIGPNSSIVFLSSFSSQNPYPSGALYTGSKAALENYSRTLAVEHAKSGLRSNCVAPALVKTEIFEKTFQSNASLDNSNDAAAEYEKFYLHGFGETTDVANAILYLLSDAARWVTGQTITLDGGYMLGMLSRVLKM